MFHACLFHLQIKGMSHFNVERIHAPISVALKALSLSFSLSGCSDRSQNPTDSLTLQREMMKLNTVYLCIFSVYCWYLWNYNIMFSWNKSFDTAKMLHTDGLSFIKVKKHLSSHKRVQFCRLYRYNHGISNINRHDHDQHNEEPLSHGAEHKPLFSPLCFGQTDCGSTQSRQKMNPVKKIKRQIKCLSQTPATLLDPRE